MIIIERKVCFYQYDSPILLGIFTDMDKAQQAKNIYIQYCKNNTDKYADMAYEQVDLENDVKLIENKKLSDNLDEIIEEVYVISLFEEGFGQTVRETLKIFNNQNDAIQYMQAKENEEVLKFPHWYSMANVKLNKIYFSDLEILWD